MDKRILFLVHDASRTGAPLLLLNFLKWLKKNSDWDFDIQLLRSGPLLEEFQALAPTIVRHQKPNIAQRIQNKIFGRHRYYEKLNQRYDKICRERGYSLIYANTGVCLEPAAHLAGRGYKTLCHVHELEYIMNIAIGADRFSKNLPAMDHFIAVSDQVKNCLIKLGSLPPERITVVNGFALSEAKAQPDARARIRNQLKLSDDDVLIGACGTLNWRKGSDLFVQIAQQVNLTPKNKRIHFLWVGAEKNNADYFAFLHDLNVCELRDHVTVLEACSNVMDYFSAMDIFALTSREDPFPLVMLEAAAMGLPIVCFASSGGGPEFVGKDIGLIAPYLDILTFANHLVNLADNPVTRRKMGATAAVKVLQNLMIQHQAPKLLEVINRFLPRNSK